MTAHSQRTVLIAPPVHYITESLSRHSLSIFSSFAWGSSAPLSAHTIPSAARALMLALCGPGRKGIQVLPVVNLFRPL